MAFLVAACDPLRPPQNPSPSLSIRSRQNGVGACPQIEIGGHLRSGGSRNAQRVALVPPGRRSRSSASNGTSATLNGRCLLLGRRRNVHVLSASSRSTTCRATPSGQPAGPSPNPGPTAVPNTFGFGARRRSCATSQPGHYPDGQKDGNSLFVGIIRASRRDGRDQEPRREPVRASNQISTTPLPSNSLRVDLSRAGAENYGETFRSEVPSRVL
jgi:hypothetical protein